MLKHAAQEINFEGEVSKKIEEDYVFERKSRHDYGQDQLKLVLSLTKYISILEGTGTPEMEDFKKAKGLVFEMMKRNETRYPPASAKKATLA